MEIKIPADVPEKAKKELLKLLNGNRNFMPKPPMEL